MLVNTCIVDAKLSYFMVHETLKDKLTQQ